MSGAVPERIAATIFVSLMSPTTLTWVAGWLLLYSSTSDLNALSSWVPALHPTHAVSVTGFDDEPFEDFLLPPPPKQPVTGNVTASRTHAVATRLIVRPPECECTIRPAFQAAGARARRSLGFLTESTLKRSVSPSQVPSCREVCSIFR